jgi:excisionase family DNA binding protein
MNEKTNLKLKMLLSEVKIFAHESVDTVSQFADDFLNILRETENKNLNSLTATCLIPERNTTELLTAKEAAEFLNVKESTIRGWRHQGKIPAQKVGGCVRFLVSDLIEFQTREKAIIQKSSSNKFESHRLRVVN